MADSETVPRLSALGAVAPAGTDGGGSEPTVHSRVNRKLKLSAAKGSGGRHQISNQKVRGAQRKQTTSAAMKVPADLVSSQEKHEELGSRQSEDMQQVVAKRLRKFEKKLRQIENIESKLRAGELLDLEQLAVLSNKPDVLGELSILRSICEAACTPEEEWRRFASIAAERVVALVLFASQPDTASKTGKELELGGYIAGGEPPETTPQDSSSIVEPEAVGPECPDTFLTALVENATRWLTDDLVTSLRHRLYCKDVNGDQAGSLPMKPAPFVDLLQQTVKVTGSNECRTQDLEGTEGQSPAMPAIQSDGRRSPRSPCMDVSPPTTTPPGETETGKQACIETQRTFTPADEATTVDGAPPDPENITDDSSVSNEEKESASAVDGLEDRVPRNEAPANSADISGPGFLAKSEDDESEQKDAGGSASSDDRRSGSYQNAQCGLSPTGQAVQVAAGSDFRTQNPGTQERPSVPRKRSNVKPQKQMGRKPGDSPPRVEKERLDKHADNGCRRAAEPTKRSSGRRESGKDLSTRQQTVSGARETGLEGVNARDVYANYSKRDSPSDGASAKNDGQGQRRTKYPTAPPGLQLTQSEAQGLGNELGASSACETGTGRAFPAESHGRQTGYERERAGERNEANFEGDWEAMASESFRGDTGREDNESRERDLNGSAEGFLPLSGGYEQARAAAAQAAALASAPYGHRYAALYHLCVQHGLKYLHPQANWHEAKERLLASATSRAQAIASGPYQECYAVLYNAYLTPGDYPFLPWTDPQSCALNGYEERSRSLCEELGPQPPVAMPLHEPPPYRRLEGALTAPCVCPSSSAVYSAPTHELMESGYRHVTLDTTHKAVPTYCGVDPEYRVPPHSVWDSFSMMPYPSQPYGSHSHSNTHPFV